MADILAMVMAGGQGKRLFPLTKDRAKPAVPFGGVYRIVDYTLSNCLNSNIRQIVVLTQYKSLSLERHLRRGWDFLPSQMGEYVMVIPPQQRVGDFWYRGTADAIYQNLYTIRSIRPKYVVILSGDHIYKMDYRDMLAFHIDRDADITISSIEVDMHEGSHFGILNVDEQHQVVGFDEKPACPSSIPGDKAHCLASMGVYIFNSEMLEDLLEADAKDPSSSHDFGKDVMPSNIDTHRIFAYNFKDKNKKIAQYWRDVGTIDSYWEANMDLVEVDPDFNLYDEEWPVRTYQPPHPPAKFVFADAASGLRGMALDSIVCQGNIICGQVKRSVISPRVRVDKFATVEDSIIFGGARICENAHVRHAIIDKRVVIAPGDTIGYDAEVDRKRFTVSPKGVVVVSRMQHTSESITPEIQASLSKLHLRI